MMSTYQTIERDRLDAVCYQHYGNLNGTVEAVLAANPRLAKLAGGWLPAGIVIALPELPAPLQALYRLW